MLKIGNIELSSPVVLAPMAGVSTLPYREFMKPFGVALSYSEMISDCGLSYGNKETYEYFKTSKKERPIGLQIFGYSLDYALKAIKILEEQADYDILDINLGCPVYKVTKQGAGSAWLKKPSSLYTYMRAICEASYKPVTAKIRLGWDENSINVKEVASLLEKAGCEGIAIHCRTAKQGYLGKADYSAIKDFHKVISIPFGVSGDIYSPEDAKLAMDISGADYVLVARGGLGHPNLVSDIISYLKDGTYDKTIDVLKQTQYAQSFAKMLVDYEGERRAIPQLRGLIPHFFSGFPGYKRIRLAITDNIHSYADLEKIFVSISSRDHL
jgi:nifR3 family TIM-barrel protein